MIMSGTDRYNRYLHEQVASFQAMKSEHGWSNYELASNLQDPYLVLLVLRDLCGLDRPSVVALVSQRFPRYPFSPLDKALARRHNSNPEVKNFWVKE